MKNKSFTQLVKHLIHKKPITQAQPVEELKQKITLENINLDQIPEELLVEFEKEDESALQELKSIQRAGVPSKLKKIREEIQRNLLREAERRKQMKQDDSELKEDQLMPGARRKKKLSELEKLRTLRQKKKKKTKKK